MKFADGRYWFETFVISDTGRLCDKDKRKIFYTDGAVDGNGDPDAVGACSYYAGESCKSSWKMPFGSARRVTSINSELVAVLGALQRAYWDGTTEVLIRTDCQEKGA